MMSSTGETHPVTLEAPVTANRAGGVGPASKASVTASTVNVPVSVHST